MTRTLLSATLLLTSVSITATAAARPMTPEDVAKLESVGTIAVSPDGNRIAYTTSSLPDVTDGEKNGTFSSVLSVATGPDLARTYLPEDVSPSNIMFSPDGRMLSFIWAKDDEKRAVWAIPVDGGAHRKIAEIDGANVSRYAWSPDSSTVYMLVGADKDKQRDAQKKGGFNAVVYEEEARLNRLFAAPVGDIISDDPREIAVPGYVSSIAITPDNRTAVINSAPTPNVDDTYTAMRVHMVDLATGNVKSVVKTPGKLGDVEISRDGKQLSMVAGIDENDPAATTLHLVNMADGSYRAINKGAAEAVVDTEWMDDGRLAAIIHVGAQSVLRVYNPDGTIAKERDPGSLILTNVDSHGGTLAVEAHSPTHTSELFVWRDNGFKRWTNHNPWLSDIDFGTQRTMSYEARDGTTIEGILIEPVGGPADNGSPTIMMVHGGPEAHYSNGWLTAYSMPGHVAAAQGYAVFHPNYRGSTAYGTAFSKAHQNDYAGKEFNDIVDAKRALVDAGITDSDRTGITGGSYGGYASAWGATALSAEYAAAVMFVGISNQISKFGTTDIPKEMFNVHSRKWPWENWQGMLEVSPIYHVDKAETPILIMHGEEDTRVAPSQSYELYRNIKVRKPDTPVRLVLYPGEPHGNRKAASHYDYNLRMMRWFDTYLKTGDRRATLPDARPQLAEGAKGASTDASTDDSEE